MTALRPRVTADGVGNEWAMIDKGMSRKLLLWPADTQSALFRIKANGNLDAMKDFTTPYSPFKSSRLSNRK